MNYNSSTSRMYFSLAVTAFVILHLSLEWFTGGVRVHYPLMRDDLPALSNWWGLLILPTAAWLSHSHIEQDSSEAGLIGLNRVAVYRLAAAFLVGACLSASFELGLGDTPLYLLIALTLAGVFYPLYRFEFMIGFVMGMVYTFGAVIPTVVICIVATISLVSYNAMRLIMRTLKSHA